MKISSRIEESLCGVYLLNRQGLWSSTTFGIGNGQRTAHARQVRARSRHHQQLQGDAFRSASKKRQAKPDFFTAWIPPPVLVKAVPYVSRAGEVAPGFSTTPITKRWSHSDAEEYKDEEDGGETKKELPSGFFQNKQELFSLVDQSQHATADEYFQLAHDPHMRGYADADGPELTVSELGEDEDFPSFSEVRAGNDDTKRLVAKLWRAIQLRLRNPYKTDIVHIYNLYQRLPDPRIPYLHSKIRHNLMKVLGREGKNHTSMLRYFAVVGDIQRSGLRLTRPEWNSALAFAARYVGQSTQTESAATMRLWKEMEAEAGIKGNAVTFNILFDVASKAGNFALSEMLYEEMERRGLPFNRYHRVSLIHFFGLKMDSDGVRAAYKEMVEAGEMIDSVVLNCVIAGFLRCGEEYAAERVYERMKAAHERAETMPYRNYMNDGVITKVLMMFAKISKKSAEGEEGDQGALRRHFQKHSPIVPDIQTYRILLNHYAVRISALDKVARLLDDMKWFKVPLHGAVFLALFKGFATYGGHDTQWNAQRLKNVWIAFQSALQENANDLYVDMWMAKWILRAFRRCCSMEDMWSVWSELRPRCEMDFDPEHVQHFEAFLADLVLGNKTTRVVKDSSMFGKTATRW